MDCSATNDHAPLSPELQIRQRWQEMGAENGVLGAASGLVPLRDGAFIQFYRGDQIYWTAKFGAHTPCGGVYENFQGDIQWGIGEFTAE